jgi:hypothetical protein
MRCVCSFARVVAGRAAFAVILLVLAACGSSPPSRFYTLHPTLSQKPLQAAAAWAPKKVVGIGPVEIPDYLDRPQIVTRSTQNRVSLSEFDLWGGALKADINRVLVENLCAILPPDRFSPIAWTQGIPMDYRVTLNVIRFDVKPGEEVKLCAQWTLSGKERKAGTLIVSSSFSERLAGDDLNDVVSAMSRAVGRLSEEIAAKIEETVREY